MILRHCLEAERRAAELRELARIARGEPYRWPAVDAKTHPAKRERRSGPRASRFNDLETKR